MRFSASSSGTNTQLTPRAIAALWSRFNHIYGHRWESAYGSALNERDELTEVAKTWSRALAEFGPDQLAHGLRACLDRSDSWPPTLPEFIQQCRPATLLAPYHALVLPALPEPDEVKEARRRTGLNELAKMKAVLGIRARV